MAEVNGTAERLARNSAGMIGADTIGMLMVSTKKIDTQPCCCYYLMTLNT
jgi:hypothetical protein